MAHLLNHSCEPNAYSRTISVRCARSGVLADHVVICAARDIAAGEELTYDYRSAPPPLNWDLIASCTCWNQSLLSCHATVAWCIHRACEHLQLHSTHREHHMMNGRSHYRHTAFACGACTY